MTVEIIPEDDDSAIVLAAEATESDVTLYKISSFTRAMTTASGSQIITGIGFRPKLILFQCGIPGTGFGSSGTVTTDSQLASLYSTPNMSPAQAYAGFAGIDVSNYQTFVVASFDADGFTLTWTKVASPTGTAAIVATCFK